jgi:alginate O-acetyltransferase complex protein AlgI
MRNVLITFIVSGLWHGANWTYIAWGLLNGLYFLPLMLRKKHKLHVESRESIRDLPQIALTFVLTLIAWTFFRADSMSHALGYLSRVVEVPYDSGLSYSRFEKPLSLAVVFLIMEWILRRRRFGLDIAHWRRPARWIGYMVVSIAIIFLGKFGGSEFIYFQF